MTKQYDNYADLITFTRASGGTALRHVGYGTELVTNGTFDDGTTGWTDASTSPSIFTVSSAEGVLTVSSGQRARARNQVSGLTVGRAYQLKFDLGEVLEVNVGYTGDASVDYLSGSQPTGTKTLNFVALGTTLYMQFHKAVDGAYTFDNVSVKEVIFDRATDPLVLFNHPTNVPRIEYDANGNRKGLLIEEARTNLLTYSEVVDGAGWTDNGSTSTNLTDGALGVWDGVSIASGGQNFQRLNTDNFVSVTSGDTLTIRAWVKEGTSGRLRINFRNVSLGLSSNIRGVFGSLVPSSNNIGDFSSVKEEDWGNGIVAVSGTITVNFTGDLEVGIGPDSVVSGETVIAYAAQLEAGSFPTSYISTAGAAASRSADVASIPTSAFGYNADKGTVVVDFETQFGTPIGFPRIWEIGNTSTSVNRVIGYIATSSSTVRCFVASNNVIEASLSVKTDPTPASGKLAFAFADDDFSCVIDGGSPVTETSGSFTTPSIPRNTLKIGGAGDSAGANISGHIKSIQYYPRRLTNTQLQELTA
jgi:hypothetical protein